MEYGGEAFPPVLGNVTHEGCPYDHYQEDEEDWWSQEQEA
jgi:hypothetical protein